MLQLSGSPAWQRLEMVSMEEILPRTAAICNLDQVRGG
jgi:hypothetical protein